MNVKECTVSVTTYKKSSQFCVNTPDAKAQKAALACVLDKSIEAFASVILNATTG